MKQKPSDERLKQKLAEMENIIEKQRVEIENLMESKELYREFVEGTEDLITRVDGHGQLVYTNHVAEKVFGCPIGMCIGRPVFDFIHSGDQESSRALFDGWIREGRTHAKFENRLVNQLTGEVFDMQCTINLRYDESGRLVGVNSISRNLTDLKRNEQALKQLTHHLQERIKELNCLYEISRIRERHDYSLDEILQEIVEIIPAALQYPEIGCARIKFDSYAHHTANFRAAPAMITRDVLVNGEPVCRLEVGYLQEKEDWKDQPFVEEEQMLIGVIAERVGNIIEREWAEIEMRNYREEIETLLQNRTAELAASEQRLEEQTRDRIKAEEELQKARNENTVISK
jgi:PAS domain S-box-containing protein